LTDLSVAQQRRRTQRCDTCKGWGYVPGHTPMKICDCVERTDHSKFRAQAPAGTKVHTGSRGAAVTKGDKERRQQHGVG
jgi:hypothetical protein